MAKKYLYVFGVVILILTLVVLGIAYVRHTAFVIIQTHPQAQPTKAVPKNPAVVGVLSAQTADSITLTIDNKESVFGVSSTTQVVSQVKNGETGKTLAEISMGTSLLVEPSDEDKNVARRISTLSPPVQNDNPSGPSTVFSGSLVSTTTNNLTIAPVAGEHISVKVTKDTVIFSNVLAGQKGRALSDVGIGEYVQVEGAATIKGFVAHTIQLLVPLQH